MPDPRLIDTKDIAIADIDDSDRLRPVSAHGVAAIVASITLTGVMKDEIILRKMKGKKQPFKLIAGGHRLQAARDLGWSEIRAKIYACDDHWAQLMEVDDNLAHAELSPLELAMFLAKRKELYLLAHPETAQGKAGAAARWEDANETISFASMIAEKRGVSTRKVQLYSKIGEALDPWSARLIRSINPGFALLNDLAKVPVEEQKRVTMRLAGGEAKTVADAMRMIRDEPAPVAPSSDDAAYEKMMAGWGRASAAARRRFLSQLWIEERGLMSEEALKAQAAA